MHRLVGVLAALLLAVPAAPSSVAATTTYETAYFPSGDGTMLHAEVYRPAGSGKVPVVLLLSPYNNGTGVLFEDRGPGKLHYPQLQTLLDRGYAVAQVTLRGFGASGGCGDLGGNGEQADAKASVEWAASRPWSTGRVGMWGISYDGWTQIMALATKPRGLAAVVAQAPLSAGYRGFWMNGSHYMHGWWLTAANGYGLLDLKPPNQAYGPEGVVNAGTGTATSPHCYATNASMTAVGDPSIPYWRERDLVARAAQSTVPVLWSHGFRDPSVKPDNMTALYPLLRGPKRAWVGQFGHRAPQDPNDPAVLARYSAEAVDWLDAYVRQDPAALERVTAAPEAVVQEGDGRWRNDTAWPPRDARATSLRLREGTYVEDPRDDGTQPADDGEVLWSVSRPLPYAVHLSGVPRVTLTARGTGPAQVVVKVFDVDPTGAARVVTRGVHAAVAGRVSFELYPQDWRFEPGHRIAVAVQGSDTYWSYPYANARPATGLTVGVDDAALAVPALRQERTAFLHTARTDVAPELTLTPARVAAAETAFRLPPRMR
ncbi:MAG TPA: CocE/NonD family hydrolase [Frankiaceae bacterium]|nr:CocE/NonD family hydrolase [Frankiaceae bacterium]